MNEYVIMRGTESFAPCAKEVAVSEKRALEQYVTESDERRWTSGRDTNGRYCLIDSCGRRYVAAAY